MADPNHINALKAAADPLAVAAALGLRGRGSRFFCPSCQGADSKTPDLSIRDNCFTCHKCGVKGDILKLVEVATGLEFPRAVAWLEDFTGIRNSGTYKHLTAKPIARPGASCAVIPRTETVAARETPDPAIFEAFLSACRPVEGRAMEWMTNRGVKPDVVHSLGIRFCGKEYQGIITLLKQAFPESGLLTAGLLKRGKEGNPVPSWYYYFAKKAGFLVIPYLKAGRPVYLKVRPPMSKAAAERLDLVRFMNTASVVPCLYNVDALAASPDEILICEGESDTWTALSYGCAAVGVPGVRSFKEAWAEDFRGLQDANGRSRVYLAFDADKAGSEGTRTIVEMFLKAGLPVPPKLPIPAGMDLTEYMKTKGG